MNFSRPFIERPIGTTLLAIGLFLIGVVAYVNLPVASLPAIEFPTIRVTATLPGGDPETMAARVAAPLERRLGEIPGVTELTSVNALGSTRIAIQFDLTRDIVGAAQDVQAAINAAAADLPADMPSLPSFKKSNPAASPILILALTSKTIPASRIYDAADTVIVQRLSQVEGVAEVTAAGAEQPAMRVRVNPMQLANMGLSIDDVRTAIVNANALSPLGIIEGARQAIAIEANAQLKTVDEYKRIILKSSNGNVVRLGDVADVRQATRNSRAAAMFNNQPAILLTITKSADANVIDTVDRIRELLPEIKRWIPEGIDISVLSDRTTTLRASVHDMQLTLAAICRAGDAGGLPVPAPADADHRRRRHRASVACRHLCRHVGGRLLGQQSDPDGAGGLGRVRRRRRHRHDREHVPQPRARIIADPRRPRRRPPDRLHRDLDQRLAGGRLHPAAVHGRHRRAPLAGILGHAGVRHRGLDRGLAHGHAHDLRPIWIL